MSKTKDELREDAENVTTPEKKLNDYSQGAPLRSRASQLVNKTYSDGGTTLVSGEVTLGSLGKTGPSAWSEADFYKDDKGYSAVITHDSYSKKPLEIRIQIPNGNEKTLFILNTKTIMHHDGANAIEADRVIKKMEQKIKSGASLEEISQDFSAYQRSEYPAEIAQQVANQKAINDVFYEKVNKMRSASSFGMCVAETVSNDFDPYMQKTFAGAPFLFVSQSARDLTGDITADAAKDNFTMGVKYNDLSNDVKEIRIECPNYKEGEVTFKTYAEIMNMETLLAMGYDEQNAQNKLNKVAEQLYNGKNIKQIFLDNRQFMTPESSERLQKDMADRAKKQKPNITSLGNGALEGRN